MNDQTPYALTIPEILHEVLANLESDAKTLRSAARVNGAWSEECLSLLWDCVEENGATRLASIPKQRRQFYANRIRSWSFDISPTDHQYQMYELAFLRLREVDIYPTHDNSRWKYQLVPTLENLRFCHSSKEPEYTLWELPSCCPNLRKLYFDFDPQINFDELGDFLKEFSKLRVLDLAGISADDITDEVFCHLTSLPLKELYMEKAITSEMVDLACQQVGSGNLFSDLHNFEAGMEWCVAARLLPDMTMLRELNLKLVSSDTNHKTFQAIGTLTELRRLCLRIPYQTEKVLSRVELLAIGQLQKLRVLRILGDRALTIGKDVTDNDLVILLSSFPKAEVIHIDAFRTILVPSLATTALAMTSTRLQRYMFLAIWDLDFAESSTLPLFASLRYMNYQ